MRYLRILFLLASISSNFCLHSMGGDNGPLRIKIGLDHKDFKKQRGSVACFQLGDSVEAFTLRENTIKGYELVLRDYEACCKILHMKDIEKKQLKTIELKPLEEKLSLNLKKVVIGWDCFTKLSTLQHIKIYDTQPEQLKKLEVEINGQPYAWHEVSCVRRKGDIRQRVVCMKKIKLLWHLKHAADQIADMRKKYKFEDQTCDAYKKTEVTILDKKFNLIPEIVLVRAPAIFKLM